MKNFKKLILIISVLAIAMLPLLSFAQSTGSGVKTCNTNITNIGDVLCKTGSLLKLLIPILIVLGIVYFVWGVITYIISGDEEAKKKGKNRIVYGLIGFVVIFSLLGIISIVISSFGIDQGNVGIVSNLVQNNSAIVENNFGTCSLGQSPKLGNLIRYTTCIINTSVIPLIFSLAVAMFIWGVVQFVVNTGDEAKREKGKQFMI